MTVHLHIPGWLLWAVGGLLLAALLFLAAMGVALIHVFRNWYWYSPD